MKRTILSLVFLLGLVGNMFGQKQYLTVSTENLYYKLDYSSSVIAYLSGKIPEGWPSKVTLSSIGGEKNTYGNQHIGYILNLLVDKGYELENTISLKDNYVQYILSISDKKSTSKIETVSYNDSDDEVTEIARYNLQGIPVKVSDKGLQIIVYSNYTTKTVIVE